MANLNKLIDIGTTVGGFIPGVGEALDVAGLVSGIATRDPMGILTSLIGLVLPGVSGGQLKVGKKLINEIGIAGAEDTVKIGRKALSKLSDAEVKELTQGQLTRTQLQKTMTDLSSEARLRKRAIRELSDADFKEIYGYSRELVKKEMDALIDSHGTHARFKNLNLELNVERIDEVLSRGSNRKPEPLRADATPAEIAQYEELLEKYNNAVKLLTKIRFLDDIDYADTWYKLYNGEIDWPIIKHGTEDITARHVVEAAHANRMAVSPQREFIASWKGADEYERRSLGKGRVFRNQSSREEGYKNLFSSNPSVNTPGVWSGSKNTAITYADPGVINRGDSRTREALDAAYLRGHDWAGREKGEELLQTLHTTRDNLEARYIPTQHGGTGEFKPKLKTNEFYGITKKRAYTPLTSEEYDKADELYEEFGKISNISGTDYIQDGGLYPVLIEMPKRTGSFQEIDFGGKYYASPRTIVQGDDVILGSINEQARHFAEKHRLDGILKVKNVKDPTVVGTSYFSKHIMPVRHTGGDLNYLNYLL